MKKVSILIYLLIGLSLIAGCTQQTASQEKETESTEAKEQIEIYENKIKQLEEENTEYDIRNKTLEEEVNSYKQFIEESVKYIDKDKLSTLAKNEWSYKIEVDGTLITDNKDILINKSDFQIIFSEGQSSLSSIIGELSEKGKIGGKYQDHLKIVDIEPTDISSTDGTIVTAFIYKFKDVPENTDFKLELSDELRERLGLSNTIINIHVK